MRNVRSIVSSLHSACRTCLAGRNGPVRSSLLQIGYGVPSISSTFHCSVLNFMGRSFHSSCQKLGLEEFFESSENLGVREIKSASPWSRDLLRLKSNEDLHKLWYVLLKERNMLSTMEYFYESEDEPMPSPERLEKVAESMSNLRDILEERESAQNMLLLGRPTKAHGEYRKSGLGHVYWYQYKEHLLPKHLAKDVHGDRPADTASFDPVLQEWHIRFQERRERNLTQRWNMLKMKWKKIRRKNPNLPRVPPKWWLDRFKTKLRYGVHPELPIVFARSKRSKRWANGAKDE